MSIAFHVAEAVWGVAALGLFAAYCRAGDLGFLLMAALCAASVVLSCVLSSWGPLVISGIAVCVMLVLISGAYRRE